MVAKNAVLTAAESIDRALQEFVGGRTETKVLVRADEWGNLHAVVATGAFQDVPKTDRKEQVWQFLKERVAPDELSCLYRIHALTGPEYDACHDKFVSSGMETEILDLGRLEKDRSNE